MKKRNELLRKIRIPGVTMVEKYGNKQMISPKTLIHAPSARKAGAEALPASHISIFNKKKHFVPSREREQSKPRQVLPGQARGLHREQEDFGHQQVKVNTTLYQKVHKTLQQQKTNETMRKENFNLNLRPQLNYIGPIKFQSQLPLEVQDQHNDTHIISTKPTINDPRNSVKRPGTNAPLRRKTENQQPKSVMRDRIKKFLYIPNEKAQERVPISEPPLRIIKSRAFHEAPII